MLHIKLKKLTLPLCLCAISVLFTPSIVLAEETGLVADQKSALAKKAAEREARKAAETKIPAEEQKAAETQMPVEEQKGK